MIRLTLLMSLMFLLTFSTNAQELSTEPDVFATSEGVLTVYPVNHGSVTFTYNDMTIVVDPFGGAELFADFGDPDIIFITDIHGDHHDAQTISGMNTVNTTFVVPQAVADQMDPSVDMSEIVIISNGESRQVKGLPVSAIPMYNIPDDETSRHTKGRGNGYVIDFGGESVYISGDTEDIPEMRSLEDIDIAFICMNLPFTMDINQAASAVIEFQPDVVYPYHHRGQDIEAFQQLVEAAAVPVEVRLKNWYSN